VRHDVEGLLVPSGDAAALSEALITLAQEPNRLARMGQAARARVLDGFTERDVMESVKELYRSMLAS
jgi:glycosyltransferase involved in cell wall biosynthesis